MEEIGITLRYMFSNKKNYIDLQRKYLEWNTSDCEPISSKLLFNHN